MPNKAKAEASVEKHNKKLASMTNSGVNGTSGYFPIKANKTAFNLCGSRLA